MTRRYTAFVAWPDRYGPEPVEEIDVDAADVIEARKLAQTELDALYEPGGKIVRIMERFGLYL